MAGAVRGEGNVSAEVGDGVVGEDVPEVERNDVAGKEVEGGGWVNLTRTRSGGENASLSFW